MLISLLNSLFFPIAFNGNTFLPCPAEKKLRNALLIQIISAIVQYIIVKSSELSTLVSKLSSEIYLMEVGCYTFIH